MSTKEITEARAEGAKFRKAVLIQIGREARKVGIELSDEEIGYALVWCADDGRERLLGACVKELREREKKEAA